MELSRANSFSFGGTSERWSQTSVRARRAPLVCGAPQRESGQEVRPFNRGPRTQNLEQANVGVLISQLY